MTYTERNLVDTYTDLLEGLSSSGKAELIENLTKSLTDEEHNDKDAAFFNSFGAFGSSKAAEEIVENIKASRKFREKEIKF